MKLLLLIISLSVLLPLSARAESVAESCLTDPPPATDTFLTTLCRDFAGFAEEQQIQAEEWRAFHRTFNAPPRRVEPLSRRAPSVEDLDREIAFMERYAGPPVSRQPFDCWATNFGFSSAISCY